MSESCVSYVKSHPEAEIRTREGSQGYDLKAVRFISENNNVYMFGTGIHIEFPHDYYGHIYARSSLTKKGIIVTNSVGIIDNDYRGEILVALSSINNKPINVDELIGAFIVQLILFRCNSAFTFNEKKEISDTNRGSGGFGSTEKLISQ